jgi:hypothetical protein
MTRLQRMVKRNISRDDGEYVIEECVTIRDYPNDTPYLGMA